jgi:hypothetical protein
MSKGLKISPGSHGEAMVLDIIRLSPMESPDNPSRIIKGSEGITLSGVAR